MTTTMAMTTEQLLLPLSLWQTYEQWKQQWHSYVYAYADIMQVLQGGVKRYVNSTVNREEVSLYTSSNKQ